MTKLLARLGFVKLTPCEAATLSLLLADYQMELQVTEGPCEFNKMNPLHFRHARDISSLRDRVKQLYR